MKIRYLTLIDSEIEEDHELSFFFFSGKEESKRGYKDKDLLGCASRPDHRCY